MLVFDASPLIHFARANELEALRDLVKVFECVTTKAVLGELRNGAERHSAIRNAIDLDWIATVSCDNLDELYLFGQYMNRLGNLERNAGEASVLAWAEAHSAAAYVDDQVACNVGRGRGVRVHRTLQPINDTAHQVGTTTVSIFKAGSTVPAKFQLKKSDGTVVQPTSLPQWVTPAKGGPTTAPVDESAYSDLPSTSGAYRWDSTGQQHIYNWGTSSGQKGSYWRIGVKLDDGQTYTVNIGLR